jgi:hypothetical protein
MHISKFSILWHIVICLDLSVNLLPITLRGLLICGWYIKDRPFELPIHLSSANLHALYMNTLLTPHGLVCKQFTLILLFNARLLIQSLASSFPPLTSSWEYSASVRPIAMCSGLNKVNFTYNTGLCLQTGFSLIVQCWRNEVHSRLVFNVYTLLKWHCAKRHTSLWHLYSYYHGTTHVNL